MRFFPQGAWFGLTRTRLGVAVWPFVALSTLCAASYGAARITLAVEYQRAKVFLEDLKSIQPGQSEASVMPLIQKYQGVRAEEALGVKDDSYVLRIDPWHLMHQFPGPNWVDDAYRSLFSGRGNWRRAVKLRSWTVRGWVRFTNGKVEAVSGNVILEGENEWLLADWRYGSKIPAHHRMEPPNTIFPSEEPRYEAHWTHLQFGDGTGEGIMSSVTPFSNAEELNAARNINLPCLMSGRGCHSLCDLLPDATRYRREHNGGGWGWNSGDWGIQPHDCK
jgi:hypothetical protein